jgi:hypothetical protein
VCIEFSVWDTSKNLQFERRRISVEGAAVSSLKGRQMGYREAREIARIRHELRERLMAQRTDGACDVLDRFRHVAEDAALSTPELRGEYERWRLRFELLGA